MPPAPPNPIQAAAAALRAGRAADCLAALGDRSGGDADYLRAMALGRLGRLPEADAAFERAASGGAPLAELRLNQGHAHRRAGDPASALAAYDQALAAGAPGAHGARGAALKALGRLAEARAAYERQLAATPRDAASLASLGGVLNALGEPEAAKAPLDAALALRPGAAVALNNRASVARATGEGTELALLRRAARAAPSDPDIQANHARAAARAGQEEEAISAYAASVRLRPLDLDTHRDLNRYLFERGRDDLFLRSYDAALPVAPDGQKARLLAEAGALARRADRAEDARARFAEALRLAPGLPAALVGRAETAPDPERARAWAAAVAAAPDDQDIALGAAWDALARGEAELAERRLAFAPDEAHRQARLAYDSVAARLLGRERYADYYAEGLIAAREIEPPARYGTLPVFLEAVREALAPRFVTTAPPVDQTLFGGVQTPGPLFETGDPALLSLRDALLRAARGVWADLRARRAEMAVGGAAPGPLGVAGAWSVRLTSGGGHRDHYHGRGRLSSAHYVTVPPDMTGAPGAGALRFGRPPLGDPRLTPERHVTPEPGLLVLFPSYMWHGVERFEAASPRVTTPADFAPIRAAQVPSTPR